MDTLAEAGRGGDPFFVSTGHLPSPEQVRREVDEAYERYRMVAQGERSRVYPALARVPAGLFGVCAVGTSGSVATAGDAEVGFTIMSVAKPFVFALVCQASAPRRPGGGWG
jgi:glutaminase